MIIACDNGNEKGAAMGERALIRNDERIEIVDVLRGLALFGILLINMEGFGYPLLHYQQLGESVFSLGWQGTLSSVVHFFVQGKFYTMFSFLFGYSFMRWLERAEERSLRVGRLYFRRMTGLLLLGLGHALLFWWGDILVTYALGGMMLYLFRHVSVRGLLGWAAGLLAGYAGLLSLLLGLVTLVQSLDPALWAADMRNVRLESEASIRSSLEVYAGGSWSELMVQRLSDVVLMLQNLPFATISVLAVFLVGAAAAKSGWLEHLVQGSAGMGRQVALLVLGGLLFSLMKLWGGWYTDPLEASGYAIWNSIGSTFGDPLLMLGYVGLIAMWCGRNTRVAKLGWCSKMGRLSLSNYLGQSLICTTLFYSYGFGLYGKLSYPMLLVTALGVYLTLLVISHWWAGRYGVGPAERVLRWFTYGRRLTKQHGADT